MCFLGLQDMWWPYGMKVILTVNRDDMNNPEYGTKGESCTSVEGYWCG